MTSDFLAIHYHHNLNPGSQYPFKLIRKLPSIGYVFSEKTGGPEGHEIPVGLEVYQKFRRVAEKT